MKNFYAIPFVFILSGCVGTQSVDGNNLSKTLQTAHYKLENTNYDISCNVKIDNISYKISSPNKDIRVNREKKGGEVIVDQRYLENMNIRLANTINLKIEKGNGIGNLLTIFVGVPIYWIDNIISDNYSYNIKPTILAMYPNCKELQNNLIAERAEKLAKEAEIINKKRVLEEAKKKDARRKAFLKCESKYGNSVHFNLLSADESSVGTICVGINSFGMSQILFAK